MTVIWKARMKIAAMYFPYREKKGLGVYDEHSNAWIKVATFNNDDAAQYFMEYLARFTGAKTEGGEDG